MKPLSIPKAKGFRRPKFMMRHNQEWRLMVDIDRKIALGRALTSDLAFKIYGLSSASVFSLICWILLISSLIHSLNFYINT